MPRPGCRFGNPKRYAQLVKSHYKEGGKAALIGDACRARA
jgi:hypothetical protein